MDHFTLYASDWIRCTMNMDSKHVGMFKGTSMMCLSLMARTPGKDKLRRRSVQRENRSRALDLSTGSDHRWIQENLHIL
jgi:hypothetical protein